MIATYVAARPRRHRIRLMAYSHSPRGIEKAGGTMTPRFSSSILWLAAHATSFDEPADKRETTSFLHQFAGLDLFQHVVFHIDNASGFRFGEALRKQIRNICIVGSVKRFWHKSDTPSVVAGRTTSWTIPDIRWSTPI